MGAKLAILLGTIAKLGHYQTIIFGGFGGFECMIAELSRLSASHAQHDR